MGLLDQIFGGDSGGGLLGGLPRDWQYQNMPSQGFSGPIYAGAQQPLTPTEQALMSMVQPGGAPAGYQPGIPGAPLAAPHAAPAAPAASPLAIGNYQMPRVGNPDLYQPQQVDTPPNAQPTQGQQQVSPLPPIFGGGGYLDRIKAGGSLIGSLLGDTTKQQSAQAQYQALIANGLTPQQAQLAILNPEAGKTLISEALTNKEKYQKTGVDAFGNENYGFVNERDQTINGKPIGQGDAGGGAQTSGGFLAPGVKSIDSSLTGDDYLKQFSPEIQAAVDNYVQGKSTPTGNPRKGFTQTVKMIAQKYGADTGQSVDDATFAARKQMRNQLSSSAPSSLGGQINIGNTAAGHLADLTEKAVGLGNWDTGLAPLTSLVNSARGLGTEQAAKMEALKGAAQHYGQEITKFYAGSPGGTAERDRFIESVNGARSPKELAAILSTEGELMRSRLDALGGQISGVLGPEGTKQYPVLRPDGQAALAKVEENVSRLRGGTPAPAAGGIPSGWSVKVH
jgi:hypothetical protein